VQDEQLIVENRKKKKRKNKKRKAAVYRCPLLVRALNNRGKRRQPRRQPGNAGGKIFGPWETALRFGKNLLIFFKRWGLNGAWVLPVVAACAIAF